MTKSSPLAHVNGTVAVTVVEARYVVPRLNALTVAVVVLFLYNVPK
jgi:hypothetical protein